MAIEPLVFLGCSTEALHVAPAIQNALAHVSVVQIWNQGFFPPNSYVLETLIAKGDQFDFAILLFSGDDTVEIRGERLLAARDNTVLEAGFFIARLGRERTFIMVPDLPNLRLPSDFAGLMHTRYKADYPPDLEQALIGQACYEIRNSIIRMRKRKPVSEKNISRSMVYLLKVLQEEGVGCDTRMLGIKLAEFNRVNDPMQGKPWEKAAQYIMAFLSYLNLVHTKAYTLVTYELTDQGKDFIDDPSTKAKFPNIL